MVYLHQVTKQWMYSSNVAVNQESMRHGVFPMQEMRNENSTQNITRIDDDKLRDIMQITDNRFVEITAELKALAEKVYKIDSNYS